MNTRSWFFRLLRCLSLVMFSLPGSFGFAEDAETLQLLRTFREEFVRITPGEGKFPASFEMGSNTGTEAEQPVHQVTFTYSFSIAKYEVPQNLYVAVMGNNPSRWRGARNSVEQMTWSSAKAFCEAATKLMRERKIINANEVIRLPSEAEWEYCCRAGTNTAYSFGAAAQAETDIDPKATILDEYAWHTGNAAGNDPAVGVLKPNPWGLYDVHGYLWEFCADSWQPTYENAPANGDEVHNSEAEQCVIRGGSWRDGYQQLRSAARKGFPVTSKSDAVGIRCVLSAERKMALPSKEERSK